MRVLTDFSQEVGCPLFEAPPFDARQKLTDIIPSLGEPPTFRLLHQYHFHFLFVCPSKYCI